MEEKQRDWSHLTKPKSYSHDMFRRACERFYKAGFLVTKVTVDEDACKATFSLECMQTGSKKALTFRDPWKQPLPDPCMNRRHKYGWW